MLLFREIDLRGCSHDGTPLAIVLSFNDDDDVGLSRDSLISFVTYVRTCYEPLSNYPRGLQFFKSFFDSFIQEKRVDLHRIGSYEGLDDSVYTCFCFLNTVNSSKQNDHKR